LYRKINHHLVKVVLQYIADPPCSGYILNVGRSHHDLQSDLAIVLSAHRAAVENGNTPTGRKRRNRPGKAQHCFSSQLPMEAWLVLRTFSKAAEMDIYLDIV
jgi:hypothetical protein